MPTKKLTPAGHVCRFGGDYFLVRGDRVPAAECHPKPFVYMDEAQDEIGDLTAERDKVESLNDQLRAQLSETTSLWCDAFKKAEADARRLRAALEVLVESGGIGPESMFRDARAALAAAGEKA